MTQLILKQLVNIKIPHTYIECLLIEPGIISTPHVFDGCLFLRSFQLPFSVSCLYLSMFPLLSKLFNLVWHSDIYIWI